MDEHFIKKLKSESERLLNVAKSSEIDLDNMDGSANYSNRVKARQLREAKEKVFRNTNGSADPFDDCNSIAAKNHQDGPSSCDRNPQFDDWKKDPGERGRRIWIWWHRVHQIEKGSLEAFWQVARSVVLNQASSASVERVFSQLNCICRTIGVGALDETVCARLMMRVNSREEKKNKKK